MKPQKSILLIHGLWVTPSSWEKFKGHFESRGYNVIASPWPGINQDVAAMRRDPSGLNGIGIAEVIAHYTKIIRSLPEPPIIMGHSYGGLITQLLIDRGLGAAGVAIDSVPSKGILILPLSTIPSEFCRHRIQGISQPQPLHHRGKGLGRSRRLRAQLDCLPGGQAPARGFKLSPRLRLSASLSESDQRQSIERKNTCRTITNSTRRRTAPSCSLTISRR